MVDKPTTEPLAKSKGIDIMEGGEPKKELREESSDESWEDVYRAHGVDIDYVCHNRKRARR